MRTAPRLVSSSLPMLLLVLAAAGASAHTPFIATANCELGNGAPGVTIVARALSTDSVVYMQNADGSFENGYCWRTTGIGDPYFGAFAEGYHGPAVVAGVRVFLSTLYEPPYRTSDFYIWGEGPDRPGAVLAVVAGVAFDAIPSWPDVAAYDVDIHAAVGPTFYVGSQADFELAGTCDYFVVADTDGPAGSPWTCVDPTSGFEPTGWQNPAGVFGPTSAMSYGVYVEAPEQGIAEPTFEPAAEPVTTWGGIKTLFGE